MRISDWSSDVCSSDLFDPQGIPAQPAAWRQGHQASQQPRRRRATTAEGLDALGPANAMDTAVMPSDLRPGKARRRNLVVPNDGGATPHRSEEHPAELPSLLRLTYAYYCLNNTKKKR